MRNKMIDQKVLSLKSKFSPSWNFTITHYDDDLDTQIKKLIDWIISKDKNNIPIDLEFHCMDMFHGYVVGVNCKNNRFPNWSGLLFQPSEELLQYWDAHREIVATINKTIYIYK